MSTPKTTGTSKEQAKEKRKRIILYVALGVVIIILLLLRCCDGGAGGGEKDNHLPTDVDPRVQAGDFEGLTKEEIIAKLNEQVAEGMINISMGVNPIFETGTSEGTLKIFNDYINRHPQVVEIYCDLPADQGGEHTRIYQSGLIPVGSRIETAPLAVDLEPGNYSCIAAFYSVDEETGANLGTAQAEILVTVLG